MVTAAILDTNPVKNPTLHSPWLEVGVTKERKTCEKFSKFIHQKYVGQIHLSPTSHVATSWPYY